MQNGPYEFFEDRAKVQDSIAKLKHGAETMLLKAAQATGPISMTVSKSGDIYHGGVTVWGNGQTMDKWILGEKQVYETPYTKGRARVGDSDRWSIFRRNTRTIGVAISRAWSG